MTIVQEAAEGGLTLERVLSDIPHDAGAMVIYVLIALFIGFIWYGNRAKPRRESSAVQHEPKV